MSMSTELPAGRQKDSPASGVGQPRVDVDDVAVLLNPLRPQSLKPQQIKLGDHVPPLNLKRRSDALAPVKSYPTSANGAL